MMMSVPSTSARGRFFLESLSSALMLVAMIHPSNAKAVATTAVNSAVPEDFPASTTVVKFSTIMPLPRPTMVPMIAISKRGISLMMVVATWNRPASTGESALSA